MMPICRIGDTGSGVCTCGHKTITGVIIEGSPDIFANGAAVARQGDTVLGSCGHTGTIVASGSPLPNSIKVARIGDQTVG